MTAVGDGLDHEVADPELSLGRRPGLYRTLCGELILPTPLTVPAGRPCSVCALEANPGPESHAELDPHRGRRMAAAWLREVRRRTTRNHPRARQPIPAAVGASHAAA